MLAQPWPPLVCWVGARSALAPTDVLGGVRCLFSAHGQHWASPLPAGSRAPGRWSASDVRVDVRRTPWGWHQGTGDEPLLAQLQVKSWTLPF